MSEEIAADAEVAPEDWPYVAVPAFDENAEPAPEVEPEHEDA